MSSAPRRDGTRLRIVGFHEKVSVDFIEVLTPFLLLDVGCKIQHHADREVVRVVRLWGETALDYTICRAGGT